MSEVGHLAVFLSHLAQTMPTLPLLNYFMTIYLQLMLQTHLHAN